MEMQTRQKVFGWCVNVSGEVTDAYGSRGCNLERNPSDTA